MIKKYHFKPYAIIIALAAILILPVLVNAQDRYASPFPLNSNDKRIAAQAAQPMASCMAKAMQKVAAKGSERLRVGNQAYCEQQVMDYIYSKNPGMKPPTLNTGVVSQRQNAFGVTMYICTSGEMVKTQEMCKQSNREKRKNPERWEAAAGGAPTTSIAEANIITTTSGSAAQDGSPPSMEKCMRVTGGDQAKCARKFAAITPPRGPRGSGSKADASPLCQINPRHLKKKSLGERKRRCN